MYKKYFKSILDFIIALIFISVLSIIFVLTIILQAITNKGEVFFLQARPGKNGAIFHIIKFKTMNNKKDHEGVLLPDSQRITPIGRILRKFSIDEIPQLINIIKGDMSLIGPRPLLPEYLSLYNSIQNRRHEVKPGITGWAQINGRNTISWSQKFELDVWYVNNLTFLLDIKILFRTVKKVLIKEGINSAASSTVEKFNGSN